MDCRGLRTLSSLLTALLVVSCGAPSGAAREPAPEPTAPPPVASVTSSASATPEGPVEPPRSQVRFQARETAAPDEMPSVEIKFPIAEKVLKTARADAYKVRLKVERWSTAQGYVTLRLDDHRPRQVDPKSPIVLADLVDEDRELSPGEHLLFAVAHRADGESVKPTGDSSRGPYAVVRFFVGAAEAEPRDLKRPLLLATEPRGTLNGEDARAFLDFYLLNAELGAGSDSARVRVLVTSPSGIAEHELRHWHALDLLGLESGDHSVRIELLNAAGEALAPAETTVVTVNRDAPKPR